MVKKGVGADSSHLLGLGWCGNGLGSNTAVVDVRGGKILLRGIGQGPASRRRNRPEERKGIPW